ncbi:cuticular protein CPF2 isoform X1 [Osmia lignaria lignaria]|uniref:cuticular protein CPF2 isoform X1 n=1 Tax=Osmia lignaria lignaria TaxID=1437193 RepID=UPI00402B2B76
MHSYAYTHAFSQYWPVVNHLYNTAAFGHSDTRYQVFGEKMLLSVYPPRQGKKQYSTCINMFRFLVICGCLLAVGQAGVIGGGLLATAPTALAVQPAAAAAALPLNAAAVAVPTITTSTSNVIRGIGNLGAISSYSKSVDTPFSSVRKADVRVNNPGIVTATAVPAPVVAVANSAVAAPVATAALAAPALLAPGLATAIAPTIATGIAGPLGLNGLALNGLGAVKVL